MRPLTSTCCRLPGGPNTVPENLSQNPREVHGKVSIEHGPCALCCQGSSERHQGTPVHLQSTAMPLEGRRGLPVRGVGHRQMTEVTRSMAFAEHVGLSLPFSSPLFQLSSEADRMLFFTFFK